VSLYDEYQYNQLIKEPTRVTKSRKSLIDHSTTTVPQRVRKSGVYHLSISDHNLIYAVRRMVMPRERPRIIQDRNYKFFIQMIFPRTLINYTMGNYRKL
jgi:hypothetical protein